MLAFVARARCATIQSRSEYDPSIARAMLALNDKTAPFFCRFENKLRIVIDFFRQSLLRSIHYSWMGIGIAPNHYYFDAMTNRVRKSAAYKESSLGLFLSLPFSLPLGHGVC
mmetsp:Transcript_13144/g.30672  ORF Transcript_13144/g.30672 Transcript_13144/m.30672 type:complete len:112 (-) Transcript_13144:244-579(-)